MPTIVKVILSVPILLAYGVVALVFVSYRRSQKLPPFDERQAEACGSKGLRRASELKKAH